MKNSLLSLFVLVTCALFFTAESSAQSAQCTFKLVDRNNTLDTFTKFSCSRAGKSCNRRLNQLRYQYPGSYRYAYCMADNNFSSDSTVVRSYIRPYDRCRTPGAVGCTEDYFDGTAMTEDYSSCYEWGDYDNSYMNYSAAESSAQCTFKLVNGSSIIDTFTKFTCSRASKRCNRRLNRLKDRYPGSYRHAYCTADNSTSSGRTLVRSYDRCQASGVVRCTAHYSDGTTKTEDYSCYGCRGYGNPAGDPCGWMCSFPQVN